MAVAIPSRARFVIVGGGIIGCSIAYHLAKLGIRDVALLERRKLTSGTTWHAAGLVGSMRATYSQTQMSVYAHWLFRSIEDETGQPTGFRQTGGFTIAIDPDRLELLKRTVAFASYVGVRATLVSPAELKERWPLLNTGDVLGAMWTPGNGQVNPVDATMAFAKGARQGGVQIFEDTPVIGLIYNATSVIWMDLNQ